jgi:hypothetical protein
MVGGLLGFFLWMFWLAWTGNILSDGSQEQSRTVTTAFFLICGCMAMIGALVGFLRNAVVIKLNNPKLLAAILGLMLGAILGFFVAILWAAWSGNLTVPGDEYEPRKAPTATFLLIISCTGIIGVLIALVQTRKWKKHHEITTN